MPTFPKTRWLLVLCLPALLTPITRGQSPAKVTPQEAGLSSTALQQIDVLLQQAVERKQVAGAVALLARDGKVGYLRAKGFQDVEAGKEMTTDSLFRIASMSKPVTSVAVMILVDDGRLTVTDPVSKYLPEFKNPKVLMPGSGGDSKLVPASREITIRDLLTHTSGLTYRFMAQKPFAELYHKADICDGLTRPSFTLAENVRHLASLPLIHQPGSAFQYSLSTDVLGRLVEVISGQDLESFMRSRIFEPLGMNDTYFDLPTDKTGRLAVVYEPGPDKRIRRVGDEPVHQGGASLLRYQPLPGAARLLFRRSGPNFERCRLRSLSPNALERRPMERHSHSEAGNRPGNDQQPDWRPPVYVAN